jgi:hypothetical protein
MPSSLSKYPDTGSMLPVLGGERSEGAQAPLAACQNTKQPCSVTIISSR